MQYRIVHEYTFNKENNSLAYQVRYLNEQEQPHIVITSTVFKGVGNTCNNSIQLSPAGNDMLQGLINNAGNDLLKNELVGSLIKISNATGGTIIDNIWLVNNLLTPLQISIPNYGVNHGQLVADFLVAWQGNRNTLVILSEIVRNGWLQKEVLPAEEHRLSTIDWVSTDSGISRVREYTDRAEGVFILNSLGQEIARIELVNRIKDPFILQINIQISSLVIDRTKQNIFGNHAEWISLNTSKLILLKGASYGVIARKVHELFTNFYEILIASSVKVDMKMILGIISIAKPIFDFSLVSRNVEIRIGNAKSRLDSNIQAIELRMASQEIKDANIKAKKTEYDRAVKDAATYKDTTSFWGAKQLLAGISEVNSCFPTSISYKKFNIPFVEEQPVEEVESDKDKGVPPPPDSNIQEEKPEQNKIVTSAPITVISSAPVSTEKKGNFWSEVLTGVAVGTISMWLMKDRSKTK